MPQRLDAAAWLALQTRARTPRVLAGLRIPRAEWTPGFEITPKGLYSKRLFESALVVYAHLWRLASAAPSSANIATAMTQLVAGLAPFHPHWKITGDRFVDRDAHQSAVRRQLDELAAAGVLRWQAGVNLEGEDARTEIQLLEPPSLSPAELKDARAQLRKWKRLHGAALHTGAPTGIPHPLKAAKPLRAADCKLLARNRVQQIRASRLRNASPTSTAPPFGTSPASQEEVSAATPSEKSTALSSPPRSGTTACGLTTGAHTRASASNDPIASAAMNGTANSSIEEGGSSLAGDLGHAGDDLGPYAGLSDAERDALLLQRVADHLAQSEEFYAAIARQGQRRTLELADSPLGRSWPAGRIKEAWVVARYGARAAAETGGSAAVRLSRERHQQLKRAVARYARHAAAAAPDGWPAAPWAAFLHAAATSGHAYPAGTIAAFDQETRRMRAQATVNDPARLEAMRRRAHARHTPTADAIEGPLSFRVAPATGDGRWPAWMRLTPDGRPILTPGPQHTLSGPSDDQIAVDEQHPWLPAPSDAHRRMIERDAFLVLGHWPPAHLDGRTLRDGRARGTIPPAQRPERIDHEILELARLEKLTIAQILAIDPDTRRDMLCAARARAARQHEHERQQLLARLTRATPTPDSDGPRP